MLILKFRKYNNSLYKLSSDFQIVTVLGLQFIIFILQQLHNLITTALLHIIITSIFPIAALFASPHKKQINDYNLYLNTTKNLIK